MTNTLYLPELREMLAERNSDQLREFCTALHPARTAEFMEGLTPLESWEVLRFAEPAVRAEIFGFFDLDRQVEIIEQAERPEIGKLIAELPADDRVDILKNVDPAVVQELMPLISAEARRDILRLTAHHEGTAGSLMTTEFARVSEKSTVREALEEVAKQSEALETIYYVYVVDDDGHLQGLVSARQLVSAMGRPNVLISTLMERGLIAVDVEEDQEDVADKVQKYDLLAIPVVDSQRHMLGIITHDDVMDVVREEAIEDVQRIAGIQPLGGGYLQTGILTLCWKRGIWLTILFVASYFTAHALKHYEDMIAMWAWLVFFIPMIMSSGGNSGNQSATLIITALNSREVGLADWWRIVRRECILGLLLGAFLGMIGYLVAIAVQEQHSLVASLVLPLTITLVVTSGAVLGSSLPLMFKKIGWDPALMSNPCVAGISDILGILIYFNVAVRLLTPVATSTSP